MDHLNRSCTLNTKERIHTIDKINRKNNDIVTLMIENILFYTHSKINMSKKFTYKYPGNNDTKNYITDIASVFTMTV